MPIDIARARRDTPGCAHVLHFNNAGASLMPQAVLDACIDHLRLESHIGGYEAADRARERREGVYSAVAALLNAHEDEIALTDSATRAWNLAFYGLPLRPGEKILTSRASYASNFIAFLHRAQQLGLEIEVVPADASGQIDVRELERRIDANVRLVALTHIPTNSGLVNPAEAVGQVAAAHDVPYLLDACQSAGHVPIDVDAIQCDVLSATGRKYLRGPRGTGFLYVRRAFLDRLRPSTPDLHAAEWTAPDAYRLRGDARRFELWESNIAADIGLGTAAEYALSLGVDAIWKRIQSVASRLRRELEALPAVRVRDVGAVVGGIVTFEMAGRPAALVKERLRSQSINVSVSAPSSTLLDAVERRLPDLIRASVHYYNTEDEIDRFCEAVRSVSSSPR